MKIERFENRKPKFHIGIGKWFLEIRIGKRGWWIS